MMINNMKNSEIAQKRYEKFKASLLARESKYQSKNTYNTVHYEHKSCAQKKRRFQNSHIIESTAFPNRSS